MADPDTSVEPTEQLDNEPDNSESDKKYTEEEFKARIEEVFSQRLAKEKAKLERQIRSGAKSTPDKTAEPKPRPSAADRELESRMATLERSLAFKDAVPDFRLNASQRSVLHDDWLKSDTDLSAVEWLQHRVEALGLAQETPTNGDSTAVPATPKGPPASDRGGPSPKPDSMRSDDPRRWTDEHVQRELSAAKSWAEGVKKVQRDFYDGLKGLTLEIPRGGNSR